MGKGLYDLPTVGNITLDASPSKFDSSQIPIRVITDDQNQFKKAHIDDAGYDIISCETVVIPKGSASLIGTDLKVAITRGYVGILKSRSGLAVKHNLEVGAGVIDSGYRGEVKVLLRNFGKEDYTVRQGDKIAQMVVLPTYIGMVRTVKNLEVTDRSSDGFNSTGY